MIWSTKPPRTIDAVAHAQGMDLHGRVRAPLCGLGTEGLYLRPEVEWEHIPNSSRCETCDQLLDSGG